MYKRQGYRVSYDLDRFADIDAYTALETFEFVAETPLTIEAVRDAFVEAITGAYDMTFEVSNSSSSRDEVTQVSSDLSPDRFRDGVPSYDVVVAQSSENPGVVVIEVSSNDYREGALPALTAAAAASMDGARAVGDELGWAIEGWDWGPGINQFSGARSVNGSIDFSAGTGVEADVPALSTQLLERVPTPTFEDIESDREFYIVSNEESWSVRYSDVFEGDELRVSFSYGA